MNLTSRMTQLLGAFRRERNGLVADTMHYDGARYGLNYGVSLPTMRQIVRGMERDHEFARFLYRQDVRCLQLAALHLADPAQLTDPEEFAFWWSGIRNSELAEEAAFALFGALPTLPIRFMEQIEQAEGYPLYLLLMAASRAEQIDAAWVAPTLRAVARQTGTPCARSVLFGAVNLLAHLAERGDEATYQAVVTAVASLGTTAWESTLREELGWRLYQ